MATPKGTGGYQVLTNRKSSTKSTKKGGGKKGSTART